MRAQHDSRVHFMVSDDSVMSVTFNESVPVGGTYANGALVWHTPHEFTVDFTSHRAPLHGGDAQDVLVVARLKIPTTAMFSIVRAISANIDRFERQYGRITPPPLEETS